MDTDPQLEILRQAAAGTLPARIDSESPVPVSIVKDLVASDHLHAIDTSNMDEDSFIDPRITTLGREYLRTLEERNRAASVPGKIGKQFPAVLKWVFRIVAALIVAYLVKQFVA